MDELRQIGANVVRLRKQKGWSRAKLSEETGICPDNLRRIETGTGESKGEDTVKDRRSAWHNAGGVGRIGGLYD